MPYVRWPIKLINFNTVFDLGAQVRHIEKTAQSRGGQSHNRPKPKLNGTTKQRQIINEPTKRLLKIGRNSFFMAIPINKNAKFTKGLNVLIQTLSAD
jgi:hypothetical protein